MKKLIHISQGFYRSRFLFFFFFSCSLFFSFFFFLFFSLFCLTNSCLPYAVKQSACCTLSSQPFCWLGDTYKDNAFEKFWKFNFHFKHLVRNTNFLVLRNPIIICIYLTTTGRRFCEHGNICHPTSKLLKWNLVQNLNMFRNPSLWFFAAGKASLVLLFFFRGDYQKWRNSNMECS